MKMSKRTDTTSSSLMNIASLPLHRLNTHTLCSVQLTVLSLSLPVFSFSNTRKRNGPIILPLVSHFSLSTTREEERVKEKKKRLLLVVIRKDHLCTWSIVSLFPIFIIISMWDESLVIHHHSDSQLSCIYVQQFFSYPKKKS